MSLLDGTYHPAVNADNYDVQNWQLCQPQDYIQLFSEIHYVLHQWKMKLSSNQ